MRPDPCGRRFKEALEQPFWSTLDRTFGGVLCQALKQPGARPPFLSVTASKISTCSGATCGCTRAQPVAAHCRASTMSTKHGSWTRAACDQLSLAAAGTPKEASAWRWLRVQGAAVKCLSGFIVSPGEESDAPDGRDLEAGQLSALLASLPALTSIRLDLRADLHHRPPAAAVRAFLAGAARAIGSCSGLQTLYLKVTLLGGLADQLPEALLRELASARALEEVTLWFKACRADRPDWPATFSLAHLVAGLAGLPRLRALAVMVGNIDMDATLPACVSRLAQLTSLRLCGFDGLRCAPGWARLPALVSLEFEECVFAGDGEAALPGTDALVALTSFTLWKCPSLRLLPASLWRLPQLLRLSHLLQDPDVGGVPRGALPVAGVPAGGAPCFASLTHLTLSGHNLAVFPPGILAAVRLAHLDLSLCCFEQLPVGVSALTALTELRLGRHAAGGLEVGGRLDARALGSLACLPKLRILSFANCSVLFASDFQAAAAHPRLERLELETSYPALGPSCMAFLGFVYDLLQQGRPDVLELIFAAVQGVGAGRRESHRFRAALEAVGFTLDDGALSDDSDEDE